jgi:hypothetical protein
MRHTPYLKPFVEYIRNGGVATGTTIDVKMIRQHRGARSGIRRDGERRQTLALPVEQPTKFELRINMNTAKAPDLTMPSSLLVRADMVIE